MVARPPPAASPTCARKAANVAAVTTSRLAHEHDDDCLRGLQQVADDLGVTRAAVNFMVHDGRLPAILRGPYWFVCTDAFEEFRRTYEPAPSAGRKLGPRSGEPAMTEVVAALLDEWGEARVDELSVVVRRAEGNVRKYLALLVAQGRAFKADNSTWVPARAAVDRATVPAGRRTAPARVAAGPLRT